MNKETTTPDKPDAMPALAPVSLLGCAHGGKIHLCRQHWQQLPPHAKDRSTAKHLIVAVEISERLIREKNKLEMECREYRKQPNVSKLSHSPVSRGSQDKENK